MGTLDDLDLLDLQELARLLREIDDEIGPEMHVDIRNRLNFVERRIWEKAEHLTA